MPTVNKIITQTKNDLRRSYIIALLLIAACTIASYFYLYASIRGMEGDAAVMNVSGAQRALVQRAAFIVRAARTATTDLDRKSATDELERIAAELASAHRALIEGDDKRGLPGNPSDAVKTLYYSHPTLIDNQLKQYLHSIEDYISGNRLGHSKASVERYITVLGRERLTHDLNGLVDQYQVEANAHIENVQFVHAMILLITLSLLVLEGRFIFLPTARAIGEKTAEILQSKMDMDYAAVHDALTGLANRRLCQQMLMEAMEDVEVNGGRAGILHLDLDGFKAVNDTLGHSAGDDVLSQTASRLRKAVRKSDTVARVGGDEFVVICPGHGVESDDEGVAERILEEFARPFTLANNVRVDVGCSVGISRYPGDATEADDLLIAADLALYQAKEAGKARYLLFDPMMRDSFQHKIELAQRVKQAIDAGEFEVFYQPQIDIESGRVVGVESLLRWRDPEHGLRSPDDFLDAIEHSGAAQTIGALVMDRAIADAAGWHREGINFGRMALNITAGQLRDTDFIDMLLDRLLEHELPPHRLAIEIVEGVVLSGHNQRLRALLDELNDLEISIEFDDFGTGYASLTHLRELPVNRIKIDRSFIRELPESEDHGNIVRGIVNILQRLGLEVIAEGVETVEQARVLNEWGCHNAQGYLFARPMPIGEVTKYLKLTDHERSLATVARSLNGEAGGDNTPELSAAS